MQFPRGLFLRTTIRPAAERRRSDARRSFRIAPPEIVVASGHLPKVRDLPRQTAQGIMLGRIGTLLRGQYQDLLRQPVPEGLAELIRKLS